MPNDTDQQSGRPHGGSVFADFVKELLNLEDKRRDSIESRGLSVITVSGTLVTLLLGLAALVSRERSFELPTVSRHLLFYAVAAFAVAALCAITTYVPQPHRTIDTRALKDSIRERWEHPTDSALKKTTVTRLDQLTGIQRSNNRKAIALLIAVVFQILAISLVTWAVAAILGA